MKSSTLAYLITYNVLQWLGWLSILLLIVFHLVQNGGNHRGVFDAIELPLTVLQLTTILETVHSAVGISKSSPAAAFMQYLGRGMALFVVTRSIPEVRYDIGVTLYLFSWTIIDTIRYPFYTTALLGSTPYPLLWARYTSFIPLYPFGYGAELVACYAAMNLVWTSGQYSFEVAGTVINFYYVLCLYVAVSCFGFIQNYTYMFSQRRKALRKVKTK